MPKNLKVKPGASKDDWGTPQAFFDQLDRIFRFSLDVCADFSNTKCPLFCAPADYPAVSQVYPGTVYGRDGLAQSWQGHTCWMNPPYSGGQVGRWLEKARLEVALGDCVVVALVPASTETAWYMDNITNARAPRALVLPVRGRITFDGAKGPAMFANHIVVYLPELKGKP